MYSQSSPNKHSARKQTTGYIEQDQLFRKQLAKPNERGKVRNLPLLKFILTVGHLTCSI